MNYLRKKTKIAGKLISEILTINGVRFILENGFQHGRHFDLIPPFGNDGHLDENGTPYLRQGVYFCPLFRPGRHCNTSFSK